MDVTDLQWWRVVGGTARKIYDEGIASRDAYIKACREFAKKYGCVDFGTLEQGIKAKLECLVLPENSPMPHGWKYKRGEESGRFIVPDRRTRAGKYATKEIASLNEKHMYSRIAYSFFTSGRADIIGPDSGGFTCFVKPQWGKYRGMDGEYVTAPANCTVEVVDGLEPIKASEILAAMGK